MSEKRRANRNRILRKGEYQPKTESGIRYVPMTEEVASCFHRIIAGRTAPKVEPMVDGSALM